MSQSIIQVENLGKKYTIGQNRQAGSLNLRETITESAKSLREKIFIPHKKTLNTSAFQDFWALKDVSFEIKQGEIVGIIGCNGAGKSTLLKILSRITEPTTGRITIKGKIASLLEVGTGFHAELTGRENIYLNGAILGMSKTEIKRKFDEIVAFSEVEKFLDTPVKRYSSGMYVRLAFAVAAHLEPEILIVDEVLAVGDAAFQKKCLGKMDELVVKENRTVIFVSHNIAAVRELCNKAYLLSGGQIVAEGSVKNVTNQYLQSLETLSVSESIPLEQRQDRSGDGSARIISFKIEDADNGEVISSNSRLKITIGYRCDKQITLPRFIANICDHEGNIGIFALDSKLVRDFPETLPSEGQVICVTAPINLTAGRCHFELELWRGSIMADRIEQAVYFDVEGFDIYDAGEIPSRDWAIALIKQSWFSGV